MIFLMIFKPSHSGGRHRKTTPSTKRRLATATALAIGASTFGVGTAQAAPAPSPMGSLPPHRSCRLKSSCSSRFAMHNPSVSMPFWTRARLPWPKSTPYQPSSASPCAMPSMPQSMPSPLARSRHAKLLAYLSPHQNPLPSRRQSQPHAQLLTHAQPMRRHAWTSTVSAHGSKTAPRPPMVQCSSPPVSQGKKPLAAASLSPAR